MRSFWHRRKQNKRSTTARDSNRAGVRREVQLLEDRLALTSLPAGFTETLITTGSLQLPTAMGISPIGEIWALQQTGAVKLINAVSGQANTVKTLTVDSSGQRGLLGIAFDPSYDGAGPNRDFVYLYYTTPRTSSSDPANNQISRFEVFGAGTATPTMDAGTLIRALPPEDEDNNPATDGDTSNNGGTIQFGPDGKLYVAVGDHNYDNSNPAQDISQVLTSPFGKILRLNPDGTNAPGNPFANGSSTSWQGAIWALGLRNPSFAFAPNQPTGTVKMFIDDQGESNWEEIDNGVAGANYGWSGSTAPIHEGFQTTPPFANYRDPVMAYDHSNSLPSPAGTAIMGGLFYPANSQFGNTYGGKYFYADRTGNFIRVFDPAQPGSLTNPDTSIGFASNTTTSGPVDLQVDAIGNLYYLAGAGTTSGKIYRISFTASGVSQIVGRELFYNDSHYDGDSASISAADDNAIATNKFAYIPGTGTASFGAVSSYTSGINGIMIDLDGTHASSLSASDFIFRVGNNNNPSTWATAPAPNSIVIRNGAGVGGSDRVEITWPNGAIQKTWLEVIVKANSNTGLPQKAGLPAGQADVFFWGSAIGDSGEGDLLAFNIDTTDEIAARNHPAALANDISPANLYDFNRDGKVNSTDQVIARDNANAVATALKMIVVALPPAAPEVQAEPQAISIAVSPSDGDSAIAGIASALASSQSTAPNPDHSATPAGAPATSLSPDPPGAGSVPRGDSPPVARPTGSPDPVRVVSGPSFAAGVDALAAALEQDGDLLAALLADDDLI